MIFEVPGEERWRVARAAVAAEPLFYSSSTTDERRESREVSRFVAEHAREPRRPSNGEPRTEILYLRVSRARGRAFGYIVLLV